MAGKRNRRREAPVDWASGTDESSTNIYSRDNSNLIDLGGPSEHGNSNGYKNNQTDGRKSHQSKSGSLPVPNQKATLGEWIQAVGETAQSVEETQRKLEETQRKLTNLQKTVSSHTHDLESIDENSIKIQKLEEERREKDEELERREKTIDTLTSMKVRAMDKMDREVEKLLKDKMDMEKEKDEQEKKFAVALEKEKNRLAQEFEERIKNQEESYQKRVTEHDESFEKRMTEQDESYEKRMQELNDDFAQKRDENDKKATFLEAENERLSAAAEKQEKKFEAQIVQLEKLKEQYDLLERAKDSIRKDQQKQEKELEQVKKEFALEPKPREYFVQGFAEVESQIENISGKYFHSLEEKDLEQVHDQLEKADPCFRSVLIDESEDSRDLRTAHAQRIISNAICEEIWNSEFTELQPEFSNLLGWISDQLDHSDHGGRKASVWTALTARALTSLQANSGNSRVSGSTEYPYLAGSARADSVINRVSILSPLVSSSQAESLRADLLSLVNLATDVWNHGPAGGLKLKVNLLLDRSHREEWRSKRFDPPCNRDETDFKTRPRIFPLFPQVMVRGPPPSSPADLELTIHPGRGLPEWSSLVVRGKAEQEDRTQFLRTAFENAKRQLQSTKRTSGRGRRESRRDSKGSMTLVSSSE